MSMQILRPVTIKAKVTEGLKVRLAEDVRRAVTQLDDEMQKLDSEVKRMQLTASISPQQQMALRQAVEQEKAARNEKKAQLQEELAAINSLPLGAEVVQGTAQSLATVEVGDDFDALVSMEIVVEDGKVIAIRKGDA
ncbi:MAG TPA: YlqD family protein [Symbiobacteriaceae bacterium]|jgi:TolA-binding protein|nr:YlqD family protein [Symbiobacteriaceae bacterium]